MCWPATKERRIRKQAAEQWSSLCSSPNPGCTNFWFKGVWDRTLPGVGMGWGVSELGSQFPLREYEIPPPRRSRKTTQKLPCGPLRTVLKTALKIAKKITHFVICFCKFLAISGESRGGPNCFPGSGFGGLCVL